MLKKPFSYYDDLEEIGYHHTVFKNDQVPLLAIIIPPGCFIGGGLMVIRRLYGDYTQVSRVTQ